MNKAVVIQINSIEALNRLVGDDPSVELAIRHAVLENFAKATLRAGLNVDAIATEVRNMKSNMEAVISNALANALETQGFKYTVHNGFRVFSELRPESRQAINEQVKLSFSAAIVDAIHEVDLGEMIRTRVESEVDRLVKKEVSRLIYSGLAERVQAAIQGVMETSNENTKVG